MAFVCRSNDHRSGSELSMYSDRTDPYSYASSESNRDGHSYASSESHCDGHTYASSESHCDGHTDTNAGFGC